MFNFFKNKQKTLKLSDCDLQNYIRILSKILDVLSDEKLSAQANIILNLIDLIQFKHLDEFRKNINGIDMWGGSGAVWEVYIEDKLQSIKFERSIIELINFMETTKILGSGIKPIKKIFIDNLQNNEG
ncbi:hypothetical protein [Flavobacterium sp. KJJ]|uniref:hypothetical protein n=1 Tax=Flavobacterium sp. KJJ TaxID=1270193 RepID=UPI0004938A81|nr:hypothetical protein [Flavobacterium sp. KJJ]